MKKYILLLVILFSFGLNAKSQIYVHGININQIDIKYCKIKIGTSFFKQRVELDYGQPPRSMNRSYITDKTGKAIRFNSEMHVVNYIVKNGWKLFSIVADTAGQGRYYIFEKESTL